jgi:hypothetical protein
MRSVSSEVEKKFDGAIKSCRKSFRPDALDHVVVARLGETFLLGMRHVIITVAERSPFSAALMRTRFPIFVRGELRAAG